MDAVKICEVVNGCEDCPKYGDDCDGEIDEMSDYISRADAIEAVCRTRCGDKAKGCPAHSCLVIEEFESLPSAETHEIRTETHECVKETHDTDLISRADAMSKCKNAENELTDEAERKGVRVARFIIGELPSADAESDDLIIKGAKGIQDGLYNITDGKLFKYKAKGGTVRTYPIVPSADAVHIETYRELYEKYVELKRASADAVQGEWTPFDRTFGRSIWVCSVCKTCTDVPCDAFTQKTIYDYCPNCGAKMKGGAE